MGTLPVICVGFISLEVDSVLFVEGKCTLNWVLLRVSERNCFIPLLPAISDPVRDGGGGSLGLMKYGLCRGAVSGTQRDCLLGTCARLRPSCHPQGPGEARPGPRRQPAERLCQPVCRGLVDVEAASRHLLGFVLREYHSCSKCFVGLLITEVSKSLPGREPARARGRDPSIALYLAHKLVIPVSELEKARLCYPVPCFLKCALLSIFYFAFYLTHASVFNSFHFLGRRACGFSPSHHLCSTNG